VKECLSIPPDVLTWVIVAVGYPLGRWGIGERTPVEEMVYWNEWGRKSEGSAIDVTASMVGEAAGVQDEGATGHGVLA
jgi:hypothetical protein